MTSKKYELGNRIEWRNEEGRLHRLDGPAVEWETKTRKWYKNGILHRVDGPAIEWFDGSKEWYLDGELHRVDGPAIEWSDGAEDWWLNGELFNSKEAWFEALTEEEKLAYLFNMKGVK